MEPELIMEEEGWSQEKYDSYLDKLYEDGDGNMTLKNPWRIHLTPDEAAQVAVLDRAIDIARESDRRNTAEREKIRRRCVARGQRVKGVG